MRTLRTVVLQTTCSGAKVEDFRTRCNQWTRTQRIRTAAAIPVEVTIVDAGSTPAYLQIGERAAHLRELGLSDRAIARAVGVSDKTVAKSLCSRVDAGLDSAGAVASNHEYSEGLDYESREPSASHQR